MDKKTNTSTGATKLLTILVSVLLIVSIIFNVVLYVNNYDLKNQVTQLTDQSTALTADLASATANSEQISQELLTANEAINQLTADATTADETISQLTANAAAADETISQMTADASLASATNADLLAQLDKAQADFSAYQAETEAAMLKSESDLLNAQTAADATIADLKAQLSDLTSELDAIKAELQALIEIPATSQNEQAVTDTTASQAETDAALPDETMTAAPTFAEDTVVATVNGEPVYGAEVLESYQRLVNSYGAPDESNLELYYAVAMDEAVTLKLVMLTAAQTGVDQYTQEELDSLYAQADADWTSALETYVTNNFSFSDETTDEEKQAAYLEAEAYYGEMGYTQATLRDIYLEYDIYDRVTSALYTDITVSDEDVQAYYDSMVQSDQALYENDIASYETAVMMNNYGYADQLPWYKPAGYRYAKHILLAVDETLLTAYTGLLEQYNAQTDPEAEGAVTAQDVEDAKAAVLASVQETIDEINQKLADGASFDELMAEYGTDPGMTSGSYPDGYEVYAGSASFIPEFVSAVFSVDTIGGISDPVISQYGVHLVQYAGDVAGGPVELTDELKASIRESLTSTQREAAFTAWYNNADIVFTGVLRSLNEINGDSAAQ